MWNTLIWLGKIGAKTNILSFSEPWETYSICRRYLIQSKVKYLYFLNIICAHFIFILNNKFDVHTCILTNCKKYKHLMEFFTFKNNSQNLMKYRGGGSYLLSLHSGSTTLSARKNLKESYPHNLGTWPWFTIFIGSYYNL